MTKSNESLNMTNQKTWSNDLPTYNWSNIADHPAPPAWGQMPTLPKSTDEWSLADIDPSEWCDPVEKQDEYPMEEDTIDYNSQEWKDGQARFKEICEAHRNSK